MAAFINYNGSFTDSETPLVGAANRGFRYGDGLFETMLMKDSLIGFWDQHTSRLWEGMKLLAFEIPDYFTPAYLQQQIQSLCRKNKHEALARVRLMVFRGNGTIYGGEEETPHFVIESTTADSNSLSLNREGYTLGVFGEVRLAADRFSHLKTNNYLPSILGRNHARRHNWTDSILLNTENGVCETTIANIFLVKNGCINTPALNQGCVAGIMRNYLLSELPRAGYRVRETAIPVEALEEADEIFITNSITGLRWVKQIGNKTYDNPCAASIYHTLIAPLR